MINYQIDVSLALYHCLHFLFFILVFQPLMFSNRFPRIFILAAAGRTTTDQPPRRPIVAVAARADHGYYSGIDHKSGPHAYHLQPAALETQLNAHDGGGAQKDHLDGVVAMVCRVRAGLQRGVGALGNVDQQGRRRHPQEHCLCFSSVIFRLCFSRIFFSLGLGLSC